MNQSDIRELIWCYTHGSQLADCELSVNTNCDPKLVVVLPSNQSLFVQDGWVQSDQFTSSQRTYKQVWPLLDALGRTNE